MDGGIAKPQSFVQERLEQKHAQARRRSRHYRPPRQERRARDDRAESDFRRRARNAEYGIASGLLQMKIRAAASLAFLILLAGSVPAFAQKSQQAAQQGADF